MKITNTIFSLMATMIFSGPLLYAADFKLQNIRVGGLGCPSELTQIVLAPDSSAASLIFQQFESRVPVLDIGPKVQRHISILNCNIFLDVQIPPGVKLDALEISYDVRGFATLERGVQGSFKSILVSKAGLGTEQIDRNPQTLTEKNWVNSQDLQEEDFTITSSKSIAIPSLCARGAGSDIVSIRLQNTLSAQILNRQNTEAQGSITIDTSDVRGGIKLKAQTSSCRNPPPPPRVERTCRIVRVNGRSQQVCN